MTIGEAIRKAREDRGYTRQQLSDMSGISYFTILCWEIGRSFPNVLLLICVADALNISLDELVGRNFKANEEELH